MKGVKYIAFIIAIAISTSNIGQTPQGKELTLADVYTLVFNGHPLIMQANLLPAAARAELQMARGAFDPTLAGDYDNKVFTDPLKSDPIKTLYWDQIYSELKIPTWFGADVKFSYENATGSFVSEERSVPQGGLFTGGITLPIGRRLIIDERRATVRQAQLFQNINDAERIKLINKTLLTVAKDYWGWYYNYQKLENLRDGLALAENRYNFVKTNVRYGEDAPIDSVEALYNYTLRLLTYQQAVLDFRNAGLILSNHLWKDGLTPLEIDTTLVPSATGSEVGQFDLKKLESLLDSARTFHPELIKYDFKLKQLDFDRRLGNEMLKPQLNLRYNFISANYAVPQQIAPFFRDNYKAGLEFYMPLLLRKERGKLNLVKNKIAGTRYEQSFALREIENDVRVAFNDLKNLEDQLKSQELIVNTLDRLLKAEQLRFENGESSLFIINARENTLITAELKLIEMRAKYASNKAVLNWAAGLRNWAN